MPDDLLPCIYEPGSDGEIFNTLTDHRVVSACAFQDLPVTFSPSSTHVVSKEKSGSWSVRGVLRWAATHDPPFHALIDTGALITGMDNSSVAKYLLEYLPPSYEGVVYIDGDDLCKVLVRESRISVPLSNCRIRPEFRFCFYDQVHSTGIDIKHMPIAKAAITLGKDSVYRDYAQGAYRMRRIGLGGQTVTIVLIPEVASRIFEDVRDKKNTRVIASREAVFDLVSSLDPPRLARCVVRWLLLNTIASEKIQHTQLFEQSLRGVYRKASLRRLFDQFSRPECIDEISRKGHIPSSLSSCVDAFREKNDLDVADFIVPPISSIDRMRIISSRNDATSLNLGDAEIRDVRNILSRCAQFSNAVSCNNDRESERAETLDVEREQLYEQEQEQRQMQEQQTEVWTRSAFSQDYHLPRPWPASLLLEPSRDLAQFFPVGPHADRSPFFSLRHLRADADFPTAIYVSKNWSNLNDLVRHNSRLKNVSVILEWHRSDNLRDEDDGTDRCIAVVSLAEAESIRRIIHTNLYEDVKDLASPPANDTCARGVVGMGLRLLTGHYLDTSRNFRRSNGDTAVANTRQALQCVRFLNCDMYYTKDEIDLLSRGFGSMPHTSRRSCFAGLLNCRRRRRLVWRDAPIVDVLVDRDDDVKTVEEQLRSSYPSPSSDDSISATRVIAAHGNSAARRHSGEKGKVSTEASRGKWACLHCTYMNETGDYFCAICGNARGSVAE
eukprot:g3325.t1